MAKISLQAAYDQAQQLLEENQPEKSIAVVQHILENVPDNLEAHRILGEAYLFNRQFEKAEAAFERVLRADPENIPAHVGIGITYERQGKLDRAINEFEQALEIKPDMTELRSQLLRLYVDAWGSEHAQLRLSRAGLARLYARGYMLPQAIQEFRSVVAEQPERFDAHVGLIEALWRNGEEDKMVEMAQHILSERPDVLKVNLLLGYVKLTSGQPDGAQYWKVAQQLDPYQNVATLLFGKLPDNVPEVSTTIPEWDEQEWRRKQEQQEAVVASPQATPAFAAATPKAPAARQSAIGQNDDDLLASLLGLQALDMSSDMSAVSQEQTGPAEPSLAPFSFDDLDTMGQEQADKTGNGLEQVQSPHAPPQPRPSQKEQEETADQPDITPLSLAELGLSEEEIALMQGGGETPSESKEEPSAEPSPFEAGLAEEDAGLSGIDMVEGQETQKEQDTSGELSGLSDIEPFDWMSEPGEPAEEFPPPAPQEPEPMPEMEQDPFAGIEGDPFAGGMQPFDLDDLGEGGLEDKVATEMPSELQPFDWSPDYDDEDETSATMPPGAASSDLDQDNLGSLQPFSLDDLDLTGGEDFPEGVNPAQVSLPPSLQPFSLEEGESLPPPPSVQEAPAMPEPIPLQSDEQDEGEVSNPAAYSWQLPSSKPDTDFLRKSSGEKSEPPPLEETETSIFAKLKQRRQELAPTEETPLPSVSDAEVAEDENLRFFSDDDISLRGGESGTDERRRLQQQEQSRPFSETEETGGDEEGTEPFSTEPFSLEGEEGIGEWEEQAEDSAALPDWPEPSEPAAGPVPTESLESGEPEIAPLSLAELGLSEEEIAALNEQEGQPSEELTIALEQQEEAGRTQVLPDEGTGATPFSLEDLGMSGSDLASEQPAPAEPEVFSPKSKAPETQLLDDVDILPFSLDDLGLDEGPSFGDEQEKLGLTADELTGWDTLGSVDDTGSKTLGGPPDTGDPALNQLISLGQKQGFVDLTDIINIVDDPVAESERIEDIGRALYRAGIEIRDGDEVIDMEEVEYPEEYEGEGEELDAAAATRVDEEIMPLSLEELGLSEEEITSLGLQEQEEQKQEADFSTVMLPPEPEEIQHPEPEPEPLPPPPPAAEASSGKDAEIAPLSLAELGLSAEEIAMLGLESGEGGEKVSETKSEEPSPASQATSPAPQAEPDVAFPAEPAPPSPQTEPEIAPLSLAELGLSAEEIAMLGLESGESSEKASEPDLPASPPAPQVEPSPQAEPDVAFPAEPAPAPPDPQAEPEIAPLSLAELGLTEEEIAMLGLGNEQSSQVKSSETTGKGEPEGFGLTDEQLTALSGLASTSSGREESAFSGSAPSRRTESEPGLEDDGLFDFSLTKEEEASLTSAPQGPRKEDLEPEEPYEPTPEDLAFVPASLDEMDDIWDLPDIAPDMGPARITIERPQRPDNQHGDQHLDDAPSHKAASDDETRTTRIRPKLPGERVPIRDRRTRPGWHGTSSSEQKQQPTAFIPTGDEDLDENLRQFEAEPENYGLCFAIAHIGMETGRYDLAISHYRILVKASEFLDDVLDDLLEQVQGVEDESIRKQFYRLTGDIYTRQKRFKEATAAYRGKLF